MPDRAPTLARAGSSALVVNEHGMVKWGMAVLFVLIAIGVIALVAMAASGRLGELPEAEPDLRPEEVGGEPTFDVVVRGYRMDEVDAVIERMQHQIDELSQGPGRGADQAT